MKNQQDKFIAEIFDPAVSSWTDIEKSVVFIEHEEFGEKAFSGETLAKDFQNKQNIVVLLKSSDTKAVIGFTYAEPTSKKETAYIRDTVIQKDFRHKHLLGILMNCMEEELKKRGYKYMERKAAVANDYAKNISKHYQGRILEQSEPRYTPYLDGQQVFFRIKL